MGLKLSQQEMTRAADAVKAALPEGTDFVLVMTRRNEGGAWISMVNNFESRAVAVESLRKYITWYEHQNQFGKPNLS